MSSKNILSVLSGCVLILFANSVYAHARLKLDSATPPRYTSDGIKTSAPCGNPATYTSTGRISIFQANTIITVDWEETVEHGGYYVFEFAPDNDQGFDDQANFIAQFDDQPGATSNNHNNYQETITLPAQPCTACTLRMRQYMLPQMTNYFSCADIVLVSGDDIVPPSMAINPTATPEDNTVILNWGNPPEGDFKAVVVTQNTVSNNDTANNLTHYLVGDTLGLSSTVIYRGTGNTFVDSGLAPNTTYYYTIFSYDEDYNYSQGTTISAISNSASTTPPPSGNGNTGGDTNSDSGGGSLFFMLLSLMLSLGTRYVRLGVLKDSNLGRLRYNNII